jgi:hypothetical protein
LKVLPVGSQGANFGMEKILKDSVDINIQKIGEKYFNYDFDFEAAFQNASSNLIVMAEGQQFLEYNLRKRFTNE